MHLTKGTAVEVIESHTEMKTFNNDNYVPTLLSTWKLLWVLTTNENNVHKISAIKFHEPTGKLRGIVGITALFINPWSEIDW